MIVYGFAASALPVWLLLAPRDYLSAFIKLGVVLALAVGILLVRPTIQMPALTRFIDGTGPVFAGTIFPFCFITIACGAISGFHALISSGTTPKLLMRESDARLVGYGSMLMESFVGVMAMIAACALEPGVYFAINSPAGIVGATAAEAAATISGWGFPLDPATMDGLAAKRRRADAVQPHRRRAVARGRHGAHLQRHDRRRAPARHLVPLRDHVRGALHPDRARRRHARRAASCCRSSLGRYVPALARTGSWTSTLVTSGVIVGAWGYFLYQGVLDPLGGINSLWPLFGIANQLLAAVALVVATTILIKMGRTRYVWITLVPMAWLVTVTLTGAAQKLFHDDPRIGFLSQARDPRAADRRRARARGEARRDAPPDLQQPARRGRHRLLRAPDPAAARRGRERVVPDPDRQASGPARPRRPTSGPAGRRARRDRAARAGAPARAGGCCASGAATRPTRPTSRTRHAGPRLSREAFYLDSLQRRYRGPSRCC